MHNLLSIIHYLLFTLWKFINGSNQYRLAIVDMTPNSSFSVLGFLPQKGITDVIQDYMHSHMTGISCIYRGCICIIPQAGGAWAEHGALSRRRQAWHMRPAGEETREAEAEPAWGNGNTTEYKDPRIDLLDSGVCWFITMLFNAVSTLMNDLSSATTKGLTPVDRGIRPFSLHIYLTCRVHAANATYCVMSACPFLPEYAGSGRSVTDHCLAAGRRPCWSSSFPARARSWPRQR